MAMLMEDLPVEVQTELRDKREHMAVHHGWAFHSHATPAQWVAFYATLSEQARMFLVENLLELSQIGSSCVQGDHGASIDASWRQLMEVVKLHNARVTEVEMLRRRLDFLEGRTTKVGPSAEEIAIEIEKVLNPPVTVNLDEQPEYLPVAFEASATPADRKLYVVKPPAGEDEH